VTEPLLQFPRSIAAPDGRLFEARACGSAMAANMWQGWIEFIPIDGGEPIRSPRETTQPNRKDTEYWATGLTDVYLEGALRRALEPPPGVPLAPPRPSVFAQPAASTTPTSAVLTPSSVLDPFSVYEKGEALLRRQLSALSAWHLVNILREYQLTDLSIETMNRMPGTDLIERIVAGVKRETAPRHSA
jgi:hypothetical protein